MEKYKYLILGAGPAGLTLANRLREKGCKDFFVIEKEKEVGGLCRTASVDGAPFDIGGGHFLDVRYPDVNEFLFRFMPKEEWNLFQRDSRIAIHGMEIGHPLEANIWQMPINDQVKYLISISRARCNTGAPPPEKFVDWIYWKLGDRITEDYMLPYNRKMFGDDLDRLGTYWLEKLPNVSFEETLRSCLERKAFGRQPGHAEFYYPKEHGYGELWRRMGDRLKDRVVLDTEVTAIDFDNRRITTSIGKQYEGDRIITTIPWKSLKTLAGLPKFHADNIRRLRYTSVEIAYHKEKMNTPAHWIYYPDEGLSYHRILVRSNFAEGAKGYWTETNASRITTGDSAAGTDYRYMNEYAYPLNTIEKPSIMKGLLNWAKSRKIYGLGRWGEWEHYNSDVTVQRALSLADELTDGYKGEIKGR